MRVPRLTPAVSAMARRLVPAYPSRPNASMAASQHQRVGCPPSWLLGPTGTAIVRSLRPASVIVWNHTAVRLFGRHGSGGCLDARPQGEPWPNHRLIPTDPTAIDAAWMHDALAAAGVAGRSAGPRRAVRRLHRHRADGSQRPLLAHVGRPRPAARTSLVGKFPTDDPTGRASGFDNGNYLTEWTFYQELAHTVERARAEVPRRPVRRGAAELRAADGGHGRFGAGRPDAWPHRRRGAARRRAGGRVPRATLGRPDAGRV